MFTEWIISALPYLNFFTQDEKDFIFDEEKCNFSSNFFPVKSISDLVALHSQCGKYGNLLSRIFDKNFVKVMVLLSKEITK